jgi:hypothetical protein
MGTLTRPFLRAEILSNLGGLPQDNDNVIRINRLIDLAALRIARAYGWQELERTTTTAITVTGTPATDQIVTPSLGIGGQDKLRSWLTLVRREGNDTPFKLIRIPERQWAQLTLGSESPLLTGAATHYRWWSDRLYFYPVPEQNWTLIQDYKIWPSLNFADGSGGELASDLDFKDDLIIALATHNAFQSLGQREDAVQWFAIYSDMLQSAINEEMDKPDTAILNRGISERDSGVVVDPVKDPFVRRTI